MDVGGYDIVIAANVLHATADLTNTVSHARGLLHSGGLLLLLEAVAPERWADLTFGLTDGWWRFTDRDLRPHQPLLERAQWESVLRKVGFSETASLPGLIGPTGGEGQFCMLARKAWEPPTAEKATSIEAPPGNAATTNAAAMARAAFPPGVSCWPGTFTSPTAVGRNVVSTGGTVACGEGLASVGACGQSGWRRLRASFASSSSVGTITATPGATTVEVTVIDAWLVTVPSALTPPD